MNRCMTLPMNGNGPCIRQPTLVALPCGSIVNSAVLWPSNGLKKSSLMTIVAGAEVFENLMSSVYVWAARNVLRLGSVMHNPGTNETGAIRQAAVIFLRFRNRRAGCRASGGRDACGCERLPPGCWPARWRGRRRRGPRRCGRAASGTRRARRRNGNNSTAARASGSIIVQRRPRPAHLGHRHRAVERHHRRRLQLFQRAVEQVDLRSSRCLRAWRRGHAGRRSRPAPDRARGGDGASPCRSAPAPRRSSCWFHSARSWSSSSTMAPSASNRAAARACCSSISAVRPMISGSAREQPQQQPRQPDRLLAQRRADRRRYRRRRNSPR